MSIPFDSVKLSSAYLFRDSSPRQAFSKIDSKKVCSFPQDSRAAEHHGNKSLLAKLVGCHKLYETIEGDAGSGNAHV
jgi:hypothetical protein